MELKVVLGKTKQPTLTPPLIIPIYLQRQLSPSGSYDMMMMLSNGNEVEVSQNIKWEGSREFKNQVPVGSKSGDYH